MINMNGAGPLVRRTAVATRLHIRCRISACCAGEPSTGMESTLARTNAR
jgi:hypothetical protein